MDGKGIETWCGRHFPQPSRLAMGTTQPPVTMVPFLFLRVKAAGAWRWSSTPPNVEVKGREQLHLHVSLWTFTTFPKVKLTVLLRCGWREMHSRWSHTSIPTYAFFVCRTIITFDKWRIKRVWGSKLHPNFGRPSKILPNSTRLRKLLNTSQFTTPKPQDVRKKFSKILKLPRFAIVVH